MAEESDSTKATQHPVSVNEDIAWLEATHRDIWERPEVRRRRAYRQRIPSPPREARQLTGIEVRRILDIIERQDLLVDLYNACMGFGLGMAVSQMPPFPGADARGVLQMTSDHLVCPSDARKFDHAWDMLAPVAFSPRNLRLHRFLYGKEPTQEKYRYDY